MRPDRWGRRTLKTRMFSKVELRPNSECWHWIAGLDDRGYGQINIAGRPVKAHIAMWGLLRGGIPEGLTLDHLCRVVSCVNPEHLEPVTRRENTLRQLAAVGHANALKTHCRDGHPLTALADGTRGCRVCRAKANREYRARRKANV